MVHCAGRDFQFGGVGEPMGGFNNLTRAFAEIIEENGGIIRTSASVKELIIENYKATGVKVDTAAGEEEFTAPAIVCNVPLQRVFSLVPRDYWPLEFAERIDRIWPMAGVMGWFCTKPAMDPDFAGVYVVPVLPGCSEADGYRGDVLFTFEDEGVMDPSRVPEGYGLMPVFFALMPRNPDELRNSDLVDHAVNSMMKFLRNMMPDFDKRVQWYFVTLTDELYSISLAPGLIGDRRLPVKHPVIKHLYFSGDSVTQWSFGINGAAGGAVHCASAVTGKDQSVILPFFMR